MLKYADLHVHLGSAGPRRQPIKITASRDLTLANLLAECRQRKGIDIVGVIDAHSPPAQADLSDLLAEGSLEPVAGGGLLYRGSTLLLLGAEVEVWAPGDPAGVGRGRATQFSGAPVHLLCYLPGLPEIRAFSQWFGGQVKNLTLSTQRCQATANEVVELVGTLGGFVVPAHIFTPFKSLLGAVNQVADLISPSLWRHVPAVELGLSSDTALASQLPELASFAFLTNSDAHSRAKIAREYTALELDSLSFTAVAKALREGGVAANYGLDPRLGKYHRSYCLTCEGRLEGEPPVTHCPVDPAHPIVLGVLDRLAEVEAWQQGQGGYPAPGPRPPYVHQVPLEFLPGVGPKLLGRLIAAFGSEMGVLHRATPEALAEVAGPKIGRLIELARRGELAISEGGGGRYGRVERGI